MSDGKRKVTSISELNGIENGEIKTREIFAFRQHGLTEKGEVSGEFLSPDKVPRVYQKIKARGIMDIEDIFYPQNITKDVKEEPKKVKKEPLKVLYYQGKYEGIKPKE